MALRKILLLTLVIAGEISFAQGPASISIIDFVKIIEGKEREALFFYSHNWRVYRDIALEKGYIKSYKLLRTSADTAANFDLILITEYADSSQLNLSEERFQEIIKNTRPNGPKLLNEIQPKDFRRNLFFKRSETLFSSKSKNN